MDENQKLLSFRSFCRFRKLSKDAGYDEPFVPYVGPLYGKTKLPRLVLCGVAIRISEAQESRTLDDRGAYRHAATWRDGFIRDVIDGGYSSGFWRFAQELFDSLAQEFKLETSDVWRAITWTNLSKLSQGTATAPPDGDIRLRALNVEQMERELAELDPDIFLCCAGNSLFQTGEILFRPLLESGFAASVPKTWVRTLANGGFAYWTMHPGRKTSTWRESVVNDALKMAQALRDSPPAIQKRR